MNKIPFNGRIGFALCLVLFTTAFSPSSVALPLKLRNTYYYVCIERDYPATPKGAKPALIRDMQGRVIAEVSPTFKRAVDIEGTGRLRDGRVINFKGRVDGEVRYVVVSAPFGLGVGNCALEPFHTIAVDPNRIPLGSLVRIEETVGMLLPNGEVHDGFWKAEDIGSAINGDRVDLFVGDGDQGAVLERAGISNLMSLTIEMVAPPSSRSCVLELPQ
jgi:3D (Asp-Asp-Asp) domain-containing protein